MSPIFLALIKQLNSSVFVLITLLLLAFWLVYKAGKIANSFNLFETKNDKIDVAIYEMKDSLSKVKATTDLLYQAHVAHLSTVMLNENRISELAPIDPSSLEFPLGGEERTIGAYGFIRDYRERRCQQRGKPKCEGYISHSPMSLTPKGEEISKAISAEFKINNYWAAIRKELEKTHLTNPYDIQLASLNLAQYCFDNIFTEKERNEIKTYAFQIGINLLEIYPIIGIIIRDTYFKEKNIALEDIDKHEPIKDRK